MSFSVLLYTVSPEAYEGQCYSVVPLRLSTDPKICDLEWPFYFKFCFRAGTSRIFLHGFRKQLCKN